MTIWKSYFDSLFQIFLPSWNRHISNFLEINPIPRALVGLCLVSFVFFIVRRFFFYEYR